MTDKKQKSNWLANSKLFQKLKSIKHIEIIIAVIFAVIVLLIYLSSVNPVKKTQSSASTNLEMRLESILSDIEGAGNVSVLINNTDNQIDGVIIVASGADNVFVKMNILKAVETVLKIPTAQIEILVGNK